MGAFSYSANMSEDFWNFLCVKESALYVKEIVVDVEVCACVTRLHTRVIQAYIKFDKKISWNKSQTGVKHSQNEYC